MGAPMHLADQRVLILGGAGAMGRAIAVELTDWGGRAVLAGRDAAKLQDAARGIARATWLEVDAADLSSLRQGVATIGAIDHIVVAIGNSGGGGAIDTTDPDMAKAAFGRFWSCYNAVHLAPERVPDSGSVVLISGSSARMPLAGFGLWTALHAAIEGLAKGASYDIAPIRVNIVSPGGIGMNPDRQLLHRRGEVGDIGLAVAAALANRAMTGAVVDVDSGERRGAWPANGDAR